MIHITTKAAKQIRASAQDGNMEGLPLRIAVVRQEDDSFHYAMGFDEVSRNDDLTFKHEDINIVVAGTCIPMLKDMTVDFVEIEVGQPQFIFLNPNDPAYISPAED